MAPCLYCLGIAPRILRIVTVLLLFWVCSFFARNDILKEENFIFILYQTAKRILRRTFFAVGTPSKELSVYGMFIFIVIEKLSGAVQGVRQDESFVIILPKLKGKSIF